jgi:glycosyltransferase involved in cell wall biosynthesis
MRVAVYSDFPYRRDAGGVSCDESFVLFPCALAGGVERLVLVGRLDPAAGRAAYRVPEGVGFAPLPHYPSLARPSAALRDGLHSLRRFDAVLREVDGVLLLGPHPLALAFALLALRRRRRVVLGVRQDLPRYTRHRRPGRPDLWLAAVALDAAWRGLARRVPVAVVGEALAKRYRRGRRVLQIAVSLVAESDIVAPGVAHSRPWNGRRRLLSVGRLDPEKGPLLLADVLAALDERWRLVVCGAGPLQAALSARLRDLGVADRAELRGYVAYDAGLRDLYRSCQALAHVSLTEGVPQVLYEAFSAGLPVVGTDVGGVGAAAGEAALLVRPGDAAAMARAVARLDDPLVRRRVVDAGLRRAREHTIERESARLLELFEDRDGGR